jgi:DNA-binding MarR family transcriptional regulator
MADEPQQAGRRRTRLYALTDGRTAAPYTALTMDTTITAAVTADARGGLPTEWQAILSMCPSPNGRAVAEIAARMHMRLTPMTVLLGELADRGLIHHRPPLEGAETTNVHLLMRIRDSLARI